MNTLPAEPKRLKLEPKSGFYNPFWYNRNMNREFIAEVINGEVLVDGEQFIVNQPGELSTIQKVFVFVGRDINCVDFYSHNEYLLAKKQYCDARDEEKRVELKRKLNRAREEAVEFNGRINLPVAWFIAIKDVLSGLSENSDGSGMNKATVYHVTLLEPFIHGRLKRESLSFLCTAPSGNDGKDWSGRAAEPIYHCDGDNYRYAPKPTCKACLKLLKQFMSQ